MDKYDNTDNHQLISTSPSFRTDLAKKLEELVPEAIADGKVDVVKLKELLAEDAGEPNERFGLFWPGKKQALRAGHKSRRLQRSDPPRTRAKIGTRPTIFSSRAITLRC